MESKRILPIVLFLALLAAPAWSAPITVEWDPNPPAEQVTGYTVHWGPQSRTAPGWTGYTGRLDVTGTQATVDVEPPVYLAVTAVNQYGLRSDYSAEVYAPAATVLLLSAPGTAAGGPCARLPATRPDGSAAQVEVCVDRAGVPTWRVLP